VVRWLHVLKIVAFFLVYVWLCREPYWFEVIYRRPMA
jgi:hypothetical protein